ncbi:NmrA family NAD(P)-binding protein [Haliangium sp.]|uniref:NmrA family NAD(P)-binding protein n=1 Tax=Haliangium sp. TaxID=2663208 RepID=UPI003D11B2DC
MHITINTPSGTIGQALAQALLDAGAELTLISRSPDKVRALAARGARVVEGSIDDAAVLDQAFAGADGLFWLTPPPVRPDFHDWALATARQAAAVASRHGIDRVVVLSSVGAQRGPGTGPVGVLLGVEQAFRDALPNVHALRPGFFMENLLRSVDTIAAAGSIFMPVGADTPFPMVATRDIAAVAAEVLRDASWRGHHIRGVHGPIDLSYDQAAEILSEALGRPVRYVTVTLDQARAAMAEAGMPDFMVDTYAELYQAIGDGRMDSAEPRTDETTTPTTLAQFARAVLAPALAAPAQAAS